MVHELIFGCPLGTTRRDCALALHSERQATPEETLETKQLSEAMAEAMEALKPEEMSVLRRLYVQDETAEEVARIFGKSSKWVRAREQDGLAALRIALAEHA